MILLRKSRELKELTKVREGFVMKNEDSNIEISCTEKFVKFWKMNGFRVIERTLIQLVS